VTLTDPLWRRKRKEPVFLFYQYINLRADIKDTNGLLGLFFFFLSPHITLHNKIKLLQGNKAEIVFVSTVFKRNGFCEGKSCLTHPWELPQDLPGGKVKSISGGSNLDNWLQCPSPTLSPSQTSTTSQSSCQGWSHLTLTHTHAYLLLSKSCPFLHVRTRHFKKIFPLFSHHYRQSITKSCQFYLPSSSRIHLVLFIFHSNSPHMESPCSPLLVFE